MTTNVKAAKKVVKPTQRSLLYLMVKLRKILPGKIRKDQNCEWIVEDAVSVKLNYYCAWEDGQKAKDKKCFPHSVTISLETKYTHHNSFRARTFQKLASGDFNYEGILVAVTQALESIENQRKEVEERDKKDKEIEKEKKEAIKTIATAIPEGANLPLSIVQHWNGYASYEIGGHRILNVECQNKKYNDWKDVYYRINIDRLTLDELKLLLEQICPIIETKIKSQVEEDDDAGESDSMDN